MRRGLKVQLAAVSLPCQLLRRSCDIIFVFVLCRIKFMRYISDIQFLNPELLPLTRQTGLLGTRALKE